MSNTGRLLTVGEVARETGLSVRTLRRYGEIGLVPPAERTPSGHRRYSAFEVRRIQRIAVLRAVGFSLAEIREVIDGDEGLLGDLVRARRRDLDARLAELELTRRRLRGAESSRSGDLMSALEEIVEGSTFTPAQLERMKARHPQAPFGNWIERIRSLDQRVRALIDQSAPLASPAARAAAREWLLILNELAGGETDIREAIIAKLDRRGAAAATHGALSEQSWFYLRGIETSASTSRR